jgi:hypothetical protein
LRQSADVWREVSDFSDFELAECIRADGIDILVDLAMHCPGNRLPVFAHRPAPVQVSWLGYPGSAGMEAIDYRLTDERMDPMGQEDCGAGDRRISSRRSAARCAEWDRDFWFFQRISQDSRRAGALLGQAAGGVP